MNGTMLTSLGEIAIDTDVIAKYAGSSAVECFGVVGMASISMKDGLAKLLRRESLNHGVNVIIENNILKSSWSPFPGIEVETTLEAYENGHKRTHIIRLEESCDAVEGGFGIPVDNYRDMNKSCTATKACIFTDSDVSTIEICEGEGTPGEFLAEANTNLLYPRTAIPYISYHFEKGVYRVSVFVAAGSNNNI